MCQTNMVKKHCIVYYIMVGVCILLCIVGAIYLVSVVQDTEKTGNDDEQKKIVTIRIEYQEQYYQVPVRHYEADVEHYSIPINPQLPEKRKVVFVYEGKESVQVQAGIYQIAQVVGALFVVTVEMSNETDCMSKKDYYIVFDEGEYSQAKQEGTCLFLYGNQEELDQQSSAFVYALKSSINAGFL